MGVGYSCRRGEIGYRLGWNWTSWMGTASMARWRLWTVRMMPCYLPQEAPKSSAGWSLRGDRSTPSTLMMWMSAFWGGSWVKER